VRNLYEVNQSIISLILNELNIKGSHSKKKKKTKNKKEKRKNIMESIVHSLIGYNENPMLFVFFNYEENYLILSKCWFWYRLVISIHVVGMILS